MGINIVISFSNKDRTFVENLSGRLNRELNRYRTVNAQDRDDDGCLQVWIYPNQPDGTRYISEIRKQINTALAIIVVLSADSVASRWVQEEVEYAWNDNHLIIAVARGERAVIKQSDLGKLLSNRTWVYANEDDSQLIAASIVKTLEALTKIRLAEIGNGYRHQRQLTDRPYGGFFEATRTRDSAPFVVKEVISDDREVLRELDAKVSLLGQQRHVALPRVEDYLQEDGRRYIVWEEIPGRSLGDMLAPQKDRPFAWADIQPWVADALNTLAFLHQHKVLHLALKPQNLKLTRERQIKLLDIGLDRRPQSAATISTTDPYLAPEQLDDRDPSPRSDIYSCGATLYTLLTGDTQPSPIKPPVAKRNRQVPEHVSQAIAKAMRPAPEQRFRSASAMLVALESPDEPAPVSAKLPVWLALVAAVTLAVVIGLVALVPRLFPSAQVAVAPTVTAQVTAIAEALTMQAMAVPAISTAPTAAAQATAAAEAPTIQATAAPAASTQAVACTKNCWEFDDTTKTMTWTGSTDATASIYTRKRSTSETSRWLYCNLRYSSSWSNRCLYTHHQWQSCKNGLRWDSVSTSARLVSGYFAYNE